jgi:hypothetical protein
VTVAAVVFYWSPNHSLLPARKNAADDPLGGSGIDDSAIRCESIPAFCLCPVRQEGHGVSGSIGNAAPLSEDVTGNFGRFAVKLPFLKVAPPIYAGEALWRNLA